MNWDLWRSHGRIFAHWTSLLFIVLVGRNFVSGICKLKPKKNYFFFKTKFFPALIQRCVDADAKPCWLMLS